MVGESDKIKISVVMPTFNEEKAIEKVVNDIKKYSSAYDTEILIVDSSKDRTREIAERLGVRVVPQEPQGHGVALRAALREAKHDIVITADCDDTYPMEKIPQLVSLVSADYDIISTNRLAQLNKKMPIMNTLGNMLFAFLVRLFYRVKVYDVSTGMFCMRKSVINNILWETNYSFPCEIIIRSNMAGFRYKEVGIPYRERVGEVTLNRWRSGKAYLKCIFNYRFKLRINPKHL